MTRRPLFWTAFAVVAVLSATVGVRYFTVALSIVSLDITMDRSTAEAEAARLSDLHGWGPGDARSAVSFGQIDSLAQPFVELEAGGRDVFFGLAEAETYHSYVWTVRRFAEGEAAESRIWFTPSGDRYGFRLSLPEDDPGAGNLTDEEARAVAERGAAEWGVDLEAYRLLESSLETLPSGRTDHAFVYERQDVDLGEGEIRLQLDVAGNRPSEVRHFVHVPETFAQRYADMRSANQAISLGANVVFTLLFMLLGAVAGTAYLLRKRWIVWRAPLIWGALTAVLFGLSILNALPLSWMQYDTAVSRSVFLTQQLVTAAAIALLGTPLLALFFMAGESLGRRAFPDHLQQWRFWSPAVAASTPALGRTVGAYLLLGVMIGYVVLFYLATSRLGGWWSPASPQVQPDLLATYQPWFEAVSTSLLAALWEESIFRAVPIAGAALLGARFGKRNAWIWGAIALQALVFAAGHADYPQQPAYARVVELTPFAFGWGVIYLYFGLIPTIFTHFLYDLSLISSLLFMAEGPGVLFNRGVIVVVGLVPLAIVLRARMGGRAIPEAPEWAYNRAWAPPEAREASAEGAPVPEAAAPAAEDAGPSKLPIPSRVAYALGAVGALLWVFAAIRAEPHARFTAAKGEVLEAARAEMASAGANVKGWSSLARTRNGRGAVGDGATEERETHRYVFEEAGPDEYRALIGSYLAPPHWVVRFVDWSAEPEERVEEYRVYVGGTGEVIRTAHRLPEARAGPSLEQDEARTAALARLEEFGLAEFGLEESAAIEVGADETNRPARRDWTFTFRDPEILRNVEGEGRVIIEMTGDAVGDAYRFVHVPEAWARSQREASSRTSVVQGIAGLLLIIAFGAAVVTAIVVWGRKQLTRGIVLPVALLVLVANVASSANGWPTTVAGFSTVRPWGLQAGTALFGLTLSSVVGAVAIGLAVALAHTWFGAEARTETPPLAAVALGLFLAGLGASATALAGGLPGTPSYSPASSVLPFLDEPLEAVTSFLLATSGMLLLAAAYRRFSGRLGPMALIAIGFLTIGLLQTSSAFQASLGMWAMWGLVGGAVVWGIVFLGAASPALVPGIFGTTAVLGSLLVMVAPLYPGGRLGAVLTAVVIVLLARAWMRTLSEASP